VALELAVRVGVINHGKLLLVDDKDAIMAKLGRTEARIMLGASMSELPATLGEFPLSLEDEGRTLRYRGGDGTGKGKREIAEVLRLLVRQDIAFEEVDTRESTLEDIFVDLVEGREGPAA
jgi:ABC-2 type transport system ATP-binding protein